MAWTERDVALDAGLHGTLTLPARAEGPAVLLLAGSGPVDRDGNLPGLTNNSLKMLAHALADRGVTVLRIDKRGIGASLSAGSREEDLRIDTYADDAVAWVRKLRDETRAVQIALIGHSEGALIATMAAQRTDIATLVLIAGSGVPADVAIERQLAAAGLGGDLRARARQIMDALKRGERVADVPQSLAALFRPSVQPYLISWLRRDPVAELRKLTQPILVVQGTSDLQITESDARALAQARSDVALAMIPGMNHVLKTAPQEHAVNLALYNDPHAPLAPGLVEAIAPILLRH